MRLTRSPWFPRQFAPAAIDLASVRPSFLSIPAHALFTQPPIPYIFPSTQVSPRASAPGDETGSRCAVAHKP